MAQYLPGTDSVQVINYTTILKGTALRSGDAINLLTVGGGAKSYSDFLKAAKELTKDRFSYEIEYRSIYGDRWRLMSAMDAMEQLPEALED